MDRMSWLDKSVNENKGVEFIGGISWRKKWMKRWLLEDTYGQLLHEPLIEEMINWHPNTTGAMEGKSDDEKGKIISESDYSIKSFFCHPDEVEAMTGLPKEQLAKMYNDAVFNPHAQLKGKDDNPIGQLIVMGTNPIDSEEQTKGLTELWNKPENYNLYAIGFDPCDIIKHRGLGFKGLSLILAKRSIEKE